MITIDQLQITSFAGITDRTVTLTPGVNILRGENESGKSSTLAFIRWMLYGYPSPAEKKHLLPLDGSLPSGSLTLTKDGEAYRILRRTAASGRDKVQITRTADGSTIGEGVEPGEYFFEISRDVFDQTAMIRQGDGSAVDGKKLAQSMNNLLFSADESVSVEGALKRLDQARVSLWYLNRKGGRITEQEEKLSSLRARLDEAKQGAGEVMELEASLAEKKKTLASHTESAELYRRQLLSYRVRCRKEKEDLVKARLQALKDSESAALRVRDAGLSSGFVPDDGYRQELQSADRALRDADREIADAEQTLALHSAQTGKKTDSTEEKFLAHGGADKAVAKCLKHFEKAKKLTVLGAVLCVVLVGIVLLILAAAEKRRARAILNEFSCRSIEELEEAASQNAEKHRADEERRKEMLASLEALRRRRAELRKRLEALASAAGCTSEQIMKELEAYDDALDQHTLLTREAQAAYDSAKALLDQEAPIEESTEDLLVLPEDFDPNTTNVHYRFYTQQIPLLENQVHQQQLRLTQLRAMREDPAALADEQAEAEQLLLAMRAEYDAIELAIESLSAASAGLRDTVSVHLAQDAAAYMKRMTCGRYETLGVDADLALHTAHPDQNDMTVNLSFLSEGTRNQAYLALRLALTRALCPTSPPPLLMDEALVYLDDSRLSQVLGLFEEMKEERQVVIFTASDREERILKNK